MVKTALDETTAVSAVAETRAGKPRWEAPVLEVAPMASALGPGTVNDDGDNGSS